MATDVSSMTNGYAPHAGYGALEQNNYAYSTNSQAPQPSTAAPPPPASSTPSNAQSTPAAQPPQSDISKDEVGWYFVEQYYTTLSRSPEKLYLFYNKRSQYVSGQETDKVAVCVGQRAINDKIKDLDFQECKVRVTNVDSQASDSNIVIQVIGEISNKSQPHKKFTQTFVLATQTNGYFVLNDIFRYLVEEEDEPEVQAAHVDDVQQVSGTESDVQEPSATEVEPKTLTSSAHPAAVESDAKQVDKSLEEKVLHVKPTEEAPVAAVNGEPSEEEIKSVEEETPAAAAQPEEVPAAEEERPSTAEEDVPSEKPKDPAPTPVASPPKQATPPQPTPAPAPKPAAPAAPRSWASLAASANRVATPAAPSTASSGTAATRAAPAKAATPASSAPSSAIPSAPSAPSAPAVQRQDAQGSDSQDEWTPVSSNHNRQASRQTGLPQQENQNRGYVKNVHENIDGAELKKALEKFGEVTWFDVNRSKNCAFVDFKTPESYREATHQPLDVGGEKLFVEERRIAPNRPGQFPQRGQFQNGRGGRGGPAGGQGAPRGNFQGGRGTSTPRGRGGFPAGPRGGARGGAQA